MKNYHWKTLLCRIRHAHSPITILDMQHNLPDGGFKFKYENQLNSLLYLPVASGISIIRLFHWIYNFTITLIWCLPELYTIINDMTYCEKYCQVVPLCPHNVILWEGIKNFISTFLFQYHDTLVLIVAHMLLDFYSRCLYTIDLPFTAAKYTLLVCLIFHPKPDRWHTIHCFLCIAQRWLYSHQSY